MTLLLLVVVFGHWGVADGRGCAKSSAYTFKAVCVGVMGMLFPQLEYGLVDCGFEVRVATKVRLQCFPSSGWRPV